MKILLLVALVATVAPEGCVELESGSTPEVEIIFAAPYPKPIGPVPQLVQPATPQPPLPTDTLHTMAEWPPKRP